jgi:large subunit ribosomal protein L15
MPLQRRLPKRGFHNIFQKRFAVINLKEIARLGETTISPQVLFDRGIVKDLGAGLKVLGEGTLSGPVTVAAHRFSASAREKILQAGGKAEVIAE